MSTEAQIQANRENAKYSTGPRSEEGKARSSKNNLRFGFVGSFCVLSYESLADFDTLHNSLRDEHNPSTPTEEILVEKMAQHLWLTRRALRLQDMMLTDSGLSLEQRNRQLSLFLRYQTTHDRAFHKCLNDMLKLRAEKRKAEIGFERKQSRAHEQAERAERQRNREREQAERHKLAVALAEAKLERQNLLNAAVGPVNSGVSKIQKAA